MAGVLTQSEVNAIRETMPGYSFETLQYIVDTFQRLDADKSGAVDSNELGGLLAGLGVEATPDQIGAFVRECDVNRDGQIGRSEFISVLYRRMVENERRKCMGEQRVWKFENPGKVKMITRCVSTCLGFVQLCLAIYAMAVFTKSQGNVADTISTWELVPVTEFAMVNSTTACPGSTTDWTGYPVFPGVDVRCDCTAVCPTNTTSGACSADEKSEGCVSVEHSCTGSGSNETCSFNCNCANRVCITTGSSCTSSQLSRGCTTKAAVPKTDLKVFAGKKLCMQRQGFNAAERATKAANKEGQCLTGYTSTCGANGSSLTVACFPNSAQCPVASIGLQLSPFVVTKSRDIGVTLPVTAIQSAVRPTVSTLQSAWTAGADVSGERFFTGDYSVFLTETEADVYAANGVPTDLATNTTYGIGYQNEIGWANDCRASRQDLIDMSPSLDKLSLMLTLTLTFVILDFLWSMGEMCTIADSKELKWLALRSCCDVLCYGANLPVIIISMAAGATVSAVTNDIASCAQSAELEDSFKEISKKAAQVAGTNLALVIFKGLKMILMSALVQYGIWLAVRWACGKKRAKNTLVLAIKFHDGDETSGRMNPVQTA